MEIRFPKIFSTCIGIVRMSSQVTAKMSNQEIGDLCKDWISGFTVQLLVTEVATDGYHCWDWAH